MTRATSPEFPPRSSAKRRLTQLDGLRGIAALIVVVHHSLLVSPWLAAPYGGDPLPGEPPAWSRWLTQSPLHLLWDGTAAVWLFFVLSGFVLTIQYLDAEKFSWLSYYPRRVLRLYLPVWGAVALTVLTVLLVPRESGAGLSWWTQVHELPVTARAVLKDLTLVDGVSGMNTPLWSLQWEVQFSLLLPLYLLVALALKRVWWLLLIAIVIVLPHFVPPSNSARYLPIFAIGVIMATRRDLLDRLARAVPGWAWAVLFVLALGLTNWPWYPAQLRGADKAMLLGVSLIVLAFYCWSGAQRLGDLRAAQWLGTRSFSIYLIHEPVVVSIGYLTKTTNPLLVLALALPVSLLLGEAFLRGVEAPAHRASQRVGREVSRRRRAAEAVG